MKDITLNKEQQSYFDTIINNVKQHHNDGAFDENILLITGKAGTGKSTLSAKLAKYFTDNPISKHRIQCTALTHQAKEELKKKLISVGIDDDKLFVSTVHSYFNIKAKINYKTGEEEFDVDSYAKKPTKSSILFIDEVSMMDEKLFNLVKSQRHLYETIVLIGDEYQIPSVNKSDYNLFKDPNIQKFKLEEIVRQAQDNPIILLASDIVEKIENEDFKDVSFCIKKTIEYSKKTDKIELVNDTRQLVEKYYEYVKDDIGKPITESKFYTSFFTTFTNKTVNSLNYIAKCIYKNSNKINYLDVGDLLVLQNPAFDPFLPYVIIAQNNEKIMITKLEEDTYEKIPCYIAYFETDTSENFIRIVKPEYTNMYEEHLEKLAQRAKIDGRQWKVFYDFKKKFTDVKQAFACTLHKSQGSTVDRVFVEARDLPWNTDCDLSFRLFYVAITRTSDKAVIMY